METAVHILAFLLVLCLALLVPLRRHVLIEGVFDCVGRNGPWKVYQFSHLCRACQEACLAEGQSFDAAAPACFAAVAWPAWKVCRGEPAHGQAVLVEGWRNALGAVMLYRWRPSPFLPDPGLVERRQLAPAHELAAETDPEIAVFP